MTIRSAALFLTQDCNLRCTYCYVPKQPRRMTAETGRDAIDFMLAGPDDAKRVAIYFFGGEPLLEKELLEELVLYGERRAPEADRQIHFGVTTNGVLYDDAFDAFAVRHKMSVNLSLDGGAATQNGNRYTVSGGASHHLVEPVLERLLARNPRQSVRMTFTAAGVDRLPEDIEYLWAKGCQTLAAAPVIEDAWTEESLDRARIAVERIGEALLARLRAGEARRVGFLAKTVRRLGIGRRPRIQCGAGTSYVGIDTEGAVYPCHRYIGYGACRMGTLSGLEDRQTREQFLRFDSGRLPGCGDCRASGICAGGCSAANLACTGSLLAPSPVQCAFQRIYYDAALRLVAGLEESGCTAALAAMRGKPPRKRTAGRREADAAERRKRMARETVS